MTSTVPLGSINLSKHPKVPGTELVKRLIRDDTMVVAKQVALVITHLVELYRILSSIIVLVVGNFAIPSA